MNEFVIDTVGEVENPDGDQFPGVILSPPDGLSWPEQRAQIRETARQWSGRVALIPSHQHAAMLTALREAYDYFDARADAYTEDGEWVETEENRLLGLVMSALGSLVEDQEDVA
jgi:hypothetical protein